MIITTTDYEAWNRIVAAVRPQWVAVSGDREWFRNALGIVYEWRRKKVVKKRQVGWRRIPEPIRGIADTVLINGKLCDARTHQRFPLAGIEPVYEGDPDWEEIERLTQDALKAWQ